MQPLNKQIKKEYIKKQKQKNKKIARAAGDAAGHE